MQNLLHVQFFHANKQNSRNTFFSLFLLRVIEFSTFPYAMFDLHWFACCCFFFISAEDQTKKNTRKRHENRDNNLSIRFHLHTMDALCDAIAFVIFNYFFGCRSKSVTVSAVFVDCEIEVASRILAKIKASVSLFCCIVAERDHIQ